MKKTLLAAGVAALMSSTAQADTLLGLYIGGQLWANTADGSFGQDVLNNGVVNRAVFDLDDQNQGSFYVAFEHPIPLIPNIKIGATTLDTVGGAKIDEEFTFGSGLFQKTFEINQDLNTTLDASFVDYTLYYEVLDNDLLTFDFGVTARDLDASIKVGLQDNAANFSSLDAEGMIPMAYLNGIVGLPFTGLNFFAEANFISYDDQTIYDAQVGVSYAILDNIAVDFDVNIGYRTVKMELNDLDGLYTDLSYDGFFAGAVVHF